MHYWQFVNGTTNEIYILAAVIKATSSRKRVNTLIPTWSQSKLFTSWVPTLQPSQTDANVAIRPKKIISNMLVLIPEINESNWYVNYLCPFFPFAQWTQWHTVMIHRLFCQRFYWIKSDRSLDVFSESAQFFFTSYCAKFCVQTSGSTEGFKQMFRRYLILD